MVVLMLLGIFRKKAADGPFELYSDLESRIRHYSQICLMIAWWADQPSGRHHQPHQLGHSHRVAERFAAGLAAIPFTFYGRRMLKLSAPRVMSRTGAACAPSFFHPAGRGYKQAPDPR